MMIYAYILAAMAGQLGPPPPQVSLMVSPAESLSAEGRAATQTILGKLQPGYLTVRPSAFKPEDLADCAEQTETPICLAEALSRAGASTGDIVLVPWENDGVLHWLCVGRNARPFVASRQSVSLGPLADLYGAGESELLQRASACLTYAGNQSGW